MKRNLNAMSKAKDVIFDSENPEWTKETFANSLDVSGKSLLDAAKKLRATRGKQIEPKKIPISIRLSENIINYFKADGAGWQSRIEQALQDVVGRK